MTPAIEFVNVEKSYTTRNRGRVSVLRNLNLEVPVGSVYGFLGPNGAGKTSAIRCLLGLTFVDTGACRIFDHPVPVGLVSVVHRIGALVETPGISNDATPWQTLRLLAALSRVDQKRIPSVLEEVDLLDRAHDPVGGFSLGMRQRLGVGITILKDPELLILDEPANGLDPAGIRDMRELIKRLAAQGRTIFLSSHQLAEVQVLCDHMAVLQNGTIVAAGNTQALLAEHSRPETVVRVKPLAEAEAVLAAEGISFRAENDTLVVHTPPQGSSVIVRLLVDHGLVPEEVRAQDVQLEDIFFKLTEEGG